MPRRTSTIDGAALRLGSIKAAMRRGIGLVPEDRKRQGLVLMMSGRANYFAGAARSPSSRLGLLDYPARRSEAAEYLHAAARENAVAGIARRRTQWRQSAESRLAKWLGRGSQLLIVDEPTRGVDIGAKAAIHELIDDLAQQGVAIMLISSELPEVLAMSTRVLVMREGKLVGEVPREQATQERVLRLMAGVAESAA